MHDTSALAIRPAVSFGEPEIRRCLPGELEKGRSYFLRGAVLGLRVADGGRRLTAEVQGTAKRPYEVTVTIEPGRPVTLSGPCSCPVGWNCKHVAAVLLQAIDQAPAGLAGKPVDPLAGPVGAWLSALPRPDNDAGATAETLFYRLDRPRNPAVTLTIEPRISRRLKSGRIGAG